MFGLVCCCFGQFVFSVYCHCSLLLLLLRDSLQEFHARCEHVMKKRFASTTPIQLLYSTAHGMNTNATGAQLGPLAELCPLLGEEDASTPPRLLGKVFIGIGTAQTTGSGFHVHAQFVPTIEREALDFHDPHIGAWNQELMLAAGVLARLSMDTALRDIQVSRSTSTAMRFQTAERCLVPHAFSASAPLPLVARLLSRGFFHVPEPILVPVNSPVGRHTEAKTMLVESSDTFLPAFGIDFAVGGLSMIDSGLFARAHALFLELQNRHLIGSLTLQQLFEGMLPLFCVVCLVLFDADRYIFICISIIHSALSSSAVDSRIGVGASLVLSSTAQDI